MHKTMNINNTVELLVEVTKRISLAYEQAIIVKPIYLISIYSLIWVMYIFNKAENIQ